MAQLLADLVGSLMTGLVQVGNARAKKLPFDQIRADTLAIAEQLLREWFPVGKVVGREFKVGNLRGEPGESLGINLITGRWKDFDTGEKGYDLIGLYAAYSRIDRAKATHELGRKLGVLRTDPLTSAGSDKPIVDNNWQPIIPPPPDTPKPDDMLSIYDVVYGCPQTQATGSHTLSVASKPATAGASGLCQSRMALSTVSVAGTGSTQTRHAPYMASTGWRPCPMRRLCCARGRRRRTQHRECFSTTHALHGPPARTRSLQADFSLLRNRSVIGWPDNDVAGHEAMCEIAKILPHMQIVRVNDLDEGDDAADVSLEDPEAWLAARLEANPHSGTRPQTSGSAATPDVDSKPLIQVLAGEIDLIATQAEDALIASSLPVFQRGESLVRPLAWEVAASDERVTVAAGLRRITVPMLVDLLAQAADWRRFDKRSNDLDSN